jgi:hypothetical protein
MVLWRYGWMDRCMDGCTEVWLDGSRIIESVVNLPRTINIHFCAALTYFLVASIYTYPWTHRSSRSLKTPITYPAASTTKIGATVTMLTFTVNACSLGTCKCRSCWRTLARIPLSRSCNNLWRKLNSIIGLNTLRYLKIYYKNILMWLYKINRKSDCK